MSKSAVVFLLLGLGCLIALLVAPAQPAMASNVLTIASGVLGVLFVAALFIGRRIKFDPLLR
jgi:Na+/citrate or Na+/malate symporter